MCYLTEVDAGALSGSGDDDSGGDSADAASTPTGVTALAAMDGGITASPAVIEAVPSRVRVSFPGTLDPTTVTTESVRFYREQQLLPGALTPSGNEVLFQPALSLPLGSALTMQVTSRVRFAGGAQVSESSVRFSVREGLWNTSRGNTGCCFAQVALTPAGTGMVGWGLVGTQAASLGVADYRPDTGLGAASWTKETISGSTLRLVVNAKGDAAATWTKDAMVFLAGKANGAVWSVSRLMYGTSLAVALSADGVATSIARHFSDKTEGRRDLVSNDFDVSGQPSDAWSPLERGTLQDTGLGAAVVLVREGGPLAAWESSASRGVQLADLKSSRPPITLSDSSGTARHPAMAADPNGYSVLAAWEAVQQSSQIQVRRFVVAGSWSPAVQISHAPISASSPVVALDASGRGLAVWQEALPNGSAIVAARFEQTRGWSEPEMVSDPAGGAASEAVLAMERGGNAIVLFKQAGAMMGSVDIVAARFVLESGFDGGKRQTLWKGGKDVSNLSLGMDDAGRALAAWVADGFLWTGRFE